MQWTLNQLYLRKHQKTIINQLGKHSYRKNKEFVIYFEILLADYLTKQFILNSVESSSSAPTKNQQLLKSILN